MPNTTKVKKINIRTAAQLKSECQSYLKEAIAEVQYDCQQTLRAAQAERLKQRETVKKLKLMLKDLQQKQTAAKASLATKTTKALQNKIKSLTTRIKSTTKNLSQTQKNVETLQVQIVAIKVVQTKEKARAGALKTFDKTYVAPNTTKTKSQKRPANRAMALVESMLCAGNSAPDFTVTNDQGASTSLHDCRGKQVVLYFYPKDDTPGCTKQAHDFTNTLEQFNEKGALVLGVSRDDASSHRQFKTKHNIGYPLLADTDETLCQAYGVIKLKNLYGKQLRSIERSTFLIDGNGIITRIWRGVKVDGHVDQVLAAIEQKEHALA